MKFASAMSSQLSLFEPLLELPKGFRYHPDVLDEKEEHTLVGEINRLPFKEFEFHGFSGKRRVVSFGWQYDFKHAKLREAAPIPAFLLPVREKGYRRGAKPLIRSRLGSDDSRIWPVAVHNLDLGPPRDHCNYILRGGTWPCRASLRRRYGGTVSRCRFGGRLNDEVE
jgi:hypothetical protein